MRTSQSRFSGQREQTYSTYLLTPDFDLIMKRLEASIYAPDPKFRYVQHHHHSHQMTLFITRLSFTVQSGEAWVLTKEDISSSFFSVNVLDVN